MRLFLFLLAVVAAEVDVSLFELIEVSATLRLLPPALDSAAVPFSFGPLDLAFDFELEAAEAPPLLEFKSLFPRTDFDLEAAAEAAPDAL